MKELLHRIMTKWDKEKTFTIGIDGLGGAGKTTIVNSLKLQLQNKNYNSIILHIDDFILLLEGIFLQRKEIRGCFDYVIYLDVPREVRLNRVINRDKYIGSSEDIKLKYERRYFPAEDKYIEEYCPIQNADYVLNYVRNEEENTHNL